MIRCNDSDSLAALCHMKTQKKETGTTLDPVKSDFFDRSWEQSWTYIRTVVDVVHEPILVLDKDFRVTAANGPFYHTFQVDPSETEKKIVYDLGNGQWDIPSLKKLLEDILPKNTFFKGFEVSHDFPSIGHKVMMLNARQIHIQKETTSHALPAIILLAMDDVTDMMNVAKRLADHTNQFEAELSERTRKLEINFVKLQKEMTSMAKR